LEKEIHLAVSLNVNFCICYARHIEDLAKHVTDDQASIYADIIEYNGQRILNMKKQHRMELLKDSLEKMKMLLSQYYHDSSGGVEDEQGIQQEESLAKDAELAIGAQVTTAEHKFQIPDILFDTDELLASLEPKSSLENPLYLQQYNIDWDQSVENKQMTAENRAFLTAETEAYGHMLTNDYIRNVFDMVKAHFLDPSRTSVFVDILEEEVIQHSNMRKMYCGSYNGTPKELSLIKAHVEACAPRPFIIHGITGSGKAVLFAAFAKMIPEWYGEDAVIISRFIGATRLSDKLATLLRYISLQLACAYRMPTPPDIDYSLTCKEYFADMLNFVSTHLTASNPLFILLDSIDRLSPIDESYLVNWIPRELPQHCYLIFGFSTENKVLWQNVQNSFTDKASFYEMLPLDTPTTTSIIKTVMDFNMRTLTVRQMEALVREAATNPWPYYLDLLLHGAIKLWHSFVDPDDIRLAHSYKAAIDTWAFKIESRLGSKFVSHAVAYLTIVPGGISELEFYDALSCDDQVLTEAYMFVDPPMAQFIRCPQIFISRLVYYLGDSLVQTSEGGLPIYHWSRAILAEAISKIYLRANSKEYSELFYYCNRVLAELFYANESFEKPLSLQRKHSVVEKGDRMVHHRPLTALNKRKLLILPVVLYNSGPESVIREEYKGKILCNVHWLITKLRGCTLREVISDFDIIEEKDNDILLIKDILHTAAKQLIEQPDLLMLEILSRFSKIPNINGDCIDKMVIHCRGLLIFHQGLILSPVYPCIDPADISLKTFKSGPTHIIGVHLGIWVIVWGRKLGLQVWKVSSSLISVYHITDEVDVENIITTLDCAHIFYTHIGFVYKWCVVTGTLLATMNLLTEVYEPVFLASISVYESQWKNMFKPMAISFDRTQLIVRINNHQMLVNQRGVLVLDGVGLKSVIGCLGKNLYGIQLTDAGFGASSEIYLSWRAVDLHIDEIYVFETIRSREELVCISVPMNAIQIPIRHLARLGNQSVFIPRPRRNSVTGEPMGLNTEFLHAEDDTILKKADRTLVAFEVTDLWLCIILFSYDYKEGASSLIAVMPDGDLRGKHISFEGRAKCLALSKDLSSAFVGYKVHGTIEVYYLPAMSLMHSYKAHEVQVNTVIEIDQWQVYSAGSDETVRLFDLRNVLAMDFTKRTSFYLEEKNLDAAFEEVYNLHSQNIISLDAGQAETTWHKLMICNEGLAPVLVDVLNGFTALQLQMPYKVG